MSELNRVFQLIDRALEKFKKEFDEELYRDGDGKIEPVDPWKEFEEETWQQLKGDNHPQS